MVKKTLNYDAVIIGFGKGAKTLAGRLGNHGKHVALIEKSNMMYGGTCINVGCIPSKSLYTSARNSLSVADDSFEQKKKLYSDAIDEKIRVTKMLREKNYAKLASNKNIEIIDGEASFVEPHLVEVKCANETFYVSAPWIFINTGSTAVVPKIEGLENNRHVFYSESIMNLKDLPRKLTVIGGGYIGLEFASMYANFGSDVTVIQDGEKFIPREDDDVSACIENILEGQKIKIIKGVNVVSVSKNGEVAYKTSDGKMNAVQSDAVLVATGRKPNVKALHVEKAGIELTERGAVKTDSLLRTTCKNVWAMGDVTGRLQFTYTSLDDYRVVYPQLEENFSEQNAYSIAKRQNDPYNVFISTPFARVGLNEKEAASLGIKARVVKMPAAGIPKAQVLRKTDGMLKALIGEDGKILGAMLICEEAYEMINIVKLAMDANLSYTVLRDQIFTHPTMSESLNDLFSM